MVPGMKVLLNKMMELGGGYSLNYSVLLQKMVK